ncbi:MAG: hypothetical protein CL847_04845 [Crocinitomicaceae bacterium]|nr:hypothetical protein [Crocinitomicaceae bacterium]|tara:strand:+ start:1392 stop:3467 length:2076 start_codon:yes stop_codon:yes gene_type:complete
MHAQLCPYPIITAELETGIWASEVSWGILNSDGNQVAGPFTDFTNNTLYIEELCMETGCYTVWMEDSYGDGWQGGSISFYDENGSLLNSGSVNEFEAFLDLFTIEDCNTINCDDGQNQLNVFLSPDQYGEELIWGILNEDGGVMLGPFSGYESGIAYQEQICLPEGCFTLWMQDTYGDGWQGAMLTIEDMAGNVLTIGSVPTTPGDEWTVPLSLGQECPYHGCTVEDAFNYNPEANINNGSCVRQSDNIELFGNWNNSSLPNNGFGGPFSDVEGLKVGDKEYAVVGSTLGAHIIDVSSPDLVEVQFLPGSTGGSFVTHRDYHINGNLLFAVCDQGSSSLQIFDLSNLPESVDTIYDNNEYCINAHNVFVDNNNDLLYLCNTNTPNFSTELLVLDIEDPSNPTVLVNMSPWISNCHDIYVENDIAWINASSQGYYVMHIDETPTMLGNLDDYPYIGSNHSGWWVPEDDIYVFADETHGSPLKVVDTSDFTDMQVLSTLSSGTDPSCIPHNLMIRDNLVFVSYYHDGLQVFDISDPSNPNLVAWYDTHLQESYADYQGAWGVHSGLPSGKVLVTDIIHGLFVLELNPEILEFCSWDVEPWNGQEISEEGYYVYDTEDEIWGSDIEWLNAIENSSLCTECSGDLDNNGSLGVSDLNIILAEFGCTENCAVDFNDDGSTTIEDLLFWLSLFGTVC